MAVLQGSKVIATCDECRTRFDPVHGGVCSSCRRLLCATHLYGSFLRRLQGRLMLGGPPQCPYCRAGKPTPPSAARR